MAGDPSATAIVEAIRDHGPISFAEYMELALYGPGGFYEHPPVGTDGRLRHQPARPPGVRRAPRRAIAELRSALGVPAPFRFVEVGAGDGTLAAPAARGPSCATPTRVTAVERSAGAREALRPSAGVERRRRPHRRPSGPHLVLAHELLDNLPFRRVRGTPDGPREVMVDVAGGRLGESLRMPDPAPQPAFSLAPGRERIEPTGARRFVVEALADDDPRFLLAIDYGSDGQDAGAVHGYRNHRVVDDVLASPGAIDITAGVPFAELRRDAEANGFRAFPTVSQGEALRAFGFEAWASSSLERQADLLNTGRGSTRSATGGVGAEPRCWSTRPAWGRFRWSVIASPGLAAPAWLERARDIR